MKIKNRSYRTIWTVPDNGSLVQIIDQRFLPFEFVVEDIATVDQMAAAIADMHVRGAGLIGASAGYGMYLAALTADTDNFDRDLNDAAAKLIATRPTAVNLNWAVNRQLKAIAEIDGIETKIEAAGMTAGAIADEDAECCRQIGIHGAGLIKNIATAKNKGEAVNVLTHCNAGWLAFVDYGSALSPIYTAHDAGIPVHVWVDETRPRNQGASLTAWELLNHGVPHTVITDNAGGHLMQHGSVDMVIVGSDRTTHTGDVCNKIGTYLKALAAKDNGVPFYAALPSSTLDWCIKDGVREIPIEARDEDEVKYIQGLADGEIRQVLLTPESSPAGNYAFDVTPARLVSGIITERGISEANEESILATFPEFKNS